MEQQYNLFLILQYLGSGFSGSQIQKNSITIQELLNNALQKIFCQKTAKTCFSGRTDSGVHSVFQPVTALVNRKIPEQKAAAGLNALLPETIRVIKAEYKPLEFSARFSAKSREYRYYIYYGSILPLQLKGFVWFLNKRQYKLDLALMKEAARLIKGQKDFGAFCAAGSSADSKIRCVDISKMHVFKLPGWLDSNDPEGRVIMYTIRANGFLYHMVRNIVSTLVDIGLKKLSVSELKKIIESKNRTNLRSITSPAKGLVLYKVNY